MDPRVAQLCREHRVTLGRIATFERTLSLADARALAAHVAMYMPAHGALEEQLGLPGCACREHFEFITIAQRALMRPDPRRELLGLCARLRAHIANEERAWSR